MNRRSFLAGSAAALAAAACSGTPRTTQRPGASPGLQLLTSHIELVAGERRFAFAVLDGNTPVRGGSGSGEVSLEGPDGSTIGPRDLRTFSMAKGSGGDTPSESPPDLIFVADVPLEKDGFYEASADVRIDGRPYTAAARIGVAGKQYAATLVPGDKAISVGTPTIADHRGVEPICTRKPECAMHGESLDAVLAAGKPVVVVFSTPALCTSRVCGPVVDVVEDARVEGVSFVHVEIYRDLQAGAITDAVGQWRIDKAGEPFTFFVGRDGAVRDRLSGPLGDWEVRERAAALKA